MIPEMIPIQQVFPRPKVEDIPALVRREVMSSCLKKRLNQGDKVAITAGSRGIQNYNVIIKALVECVREIGFSPVIIPAMGSHGQGTAEGQKRVLAEYKITEQDVGAPVLSTMEVRQIGETEEGIPVFWDRFALECGGIIVVNRIKPHTSFHGHIESGLMKMMVIGLGKHKGATVVHSFGIERMSQTILSCARLIMKNAPIALGLGIIENAYEDTARIVAVEPEEIERLEPKFLEEARGLMPSLPVSDIDVLIVEKIGKDISGTGMDTQIIGRMGIQGIADPPSPSIRWIVVLDLSERSEGNALGIGLADITTRRLFQKIDMKAMYTNAITTTFLRRVFIPVVMDNDEKAIETALSLTQFPDKARVVRIKNTLELEFCWISKSILDEVKDKKNIKVLGPSQPWYFGSSI